jgi:hypothetical protein
MLWDLTAKVGPKRTISGYQVFAWYGEKIQESAGSNEWIDTVVSSLSKAAIRTEAQRMSKGASAESTAGRYFREWLSDSRAVATKTFELLKTFEVINPNTVDNTPHLRTRCALTANGMIELRRAKKYTRPIGTVFPALEVDAQ